MSIDEIVAASGPASVFPIKVEFSRRYNTHAGETSFFMVREPTMADWMAIGDFEDHRMELGPDNTPTAMTVVTDREAYIKWMVQLTGIDRVIIGALTYADGQKLAAAVRRALVVFRSGNLSSAPTSSSSSSE